MNTPVNSEAPAGDVQQPGVLRRLLTPDFIISSVLLVVFVAGLLASRNWPADSRLFPLMVTTFGIALALLRMGLSLRRAAPAVSAERRVVGDVELTDEDDEADQALEYVFERASRRDWTRALGSVAAFFLGLLLVGIIPTILVFTVLYLLIEARTSIVVAVVYAVVLGGALYAASEILNISLPPGLLLA